MRVPGTPLHRFKGSFNKTQGFVLLKLLTLKPFAAPAYDTLKYFFYFAEKIRLDICELSANQTIHMICQALFSLQNKIK